MTTFTKEQLVERASAVKDRLEWALAAVPGRKDAEMDLHLAEIALASLEAEPVAFSDKRNLRDVDGDSTHTARMWGKYNFEVGDMALYAAPPAPVSVPDEIQKLKDGRGFKYVKDGVHYSVNYANGWNQCRAAMQGKAELVSQPYKLPDDFDFDRFNDVPWLEAVASNPHMHSPTTSTIAMVALELNRKLDAGNYPAIPDGWVMVPVEPTADMYDAGDRQLATKQVWDAMIAAAPQQEVK